MPAALKALLAQLAAWLVAVALARAGVLPPGLWPLVAAQAAGATLVALALRSARWWLPIHLAFSPLLVLAADLRIAPGWYLLVFAALLATYWTSFRTQVPLYFSSRAAAAAVAGLMPRRAVRVLDLGSGTASLLRALARLRPESRFHGIEAAPAPYLAGRLLARGRENLRLERGDFFTACWSEYDLVYAFLSPVPMARVWDKAEREMRPESLLVSNSFAVPGVAPERVIEAGGTRLFVYRPGAPRK